MGGGAALQVDVLGPIRARDGEGREIRPDGLLQRRLLALLVLHRGHVVSPDAAVEALWPSRRPQEPLAALQTHVFRLRRTLPAGLVASTDGGYRLEAADVEVDADRLAEAVRADRPDDPAVVTLIDAALDRWHGPAYAELDDLDDGRVEAGRHHRRRRPDVGRGDVMSARRTWWWSQARMPSRHGSAVRRGRALDATIRRQAQQDAVLAWLAERPGRP